MSIVHPREELDQIIRGEHGHPHAVLGPHVVGGEVWVRVYKPLADAVVVRHADGDTALEHVHEGVWAGRLPQADVPDYRITVTYGDHSIDVDDPYRFLPTLGELDQHLLGEGRHEQLWDVLGARVHHYESPLGGTVSGTAFAVWAPSARGVRVKGDFNSWDGREHPMRQLGTSGVWELFVPDTGAGTAYKFWIYGADGTWREKADPMAYYAEVAPATSSKVFESSHTWGDQEWMEARARAPSPWRGRCRSTRCTSPRGSGTPGAPSGPTTRWPTTWCPTSPTSASPTSS